MSERGEEKFRIEELERQWRDGQRRWRGVAKFGELACQKHRMLEEAPEGGAACFFTPAYSGKRKRKRGQRRSEAAKLRLKCQCYYVQCEGCVLGEGGVGQLPREQDTMLDLHGIPT